MAFNQLSNAEAERLAILGEECAEAIHIVCKILRHGYESCHPDGGPTNRELLMKELGDVYFSMLLLSKNQDINIDSVRDSATIKALTIGKYLHHQ